MPTVTLKVTDHDRELWVEAASNAGISLSEWLRQAAGARLGSEETAIGAAVSSEPNRERPPRDRPEMQDTEPVPGIHFNEPDPETEVQAALAEARQLLSQPPAPREFRGPHWKPEKGKKKR